MPPVDDDKHGYWQSLAEHDSTPEFREASEREFLELLPEEFSAGSRRRFLQLMGASVALAGAGCGGVDPDWPKYRTAKILPLAFRAPGVDPGKPFWFATSMELSGVAKPVLAKSYDGRPIKIEGNPEHPASLGAADLLAQASVLELYDPARSQAPCRFDGGRVTEATWEVLASEMHPVVDAARARRGQGLAILSEATSSPSFAALRARLSETYPAAAWYEWEPLTRDAAREGARLVFGQPLRTHLHIADADVVVSLDDDFLFAHPQAVAHARAFVARRRAEDGTMSRLYVLESAYSITGSQADDRRAVPPGALPQVAWALAAHLFLESGVALPPELGHLQPLLTGARAHGEHWPFVARIAGELAEKRGHGLVTCGPTQPAGVHALVHLMNAALGNAGHTVTYTAEPAADRATHAGSISALAAELQAGRVDALILLGGNPVFDAPADLGFEASMRKAGVQLHLSLHRNETSLASTWHAPRAHYLEAWSDALSWDGTYTLAQPLIQPLFGGLTPAELLSLLLEDRAADGLALVRAGFAAAVGGGDAEWTRAVHDGFVAGSAPAAVLPDLAPAAWKPATSDFEWHAPSGSTVEVALRGSATIHDGRFANHPWLMELPDPMTKLTWDNAALLSPLTARALGLSHGDVVRLSKGERSLELPVYLMPGQARGSVTVALGWGRRAGGAVAVPQKRRREGGGFDAYVLRTSQALWTVPGVEIAATGGRYPLSGTQDHHAIFNPEQGRGQARRLHQLYREATLSEYREHPDFAKHVVHHPPLVSLWKEHDYSTGHRWGMTIDLAACIGCGACVVACQAENNSPTVGKAEVARGREMHWIRVDRYFHGDPDQPRAMHQPVPCQQCENAPCEQVCPVAATVHSHEGLNDMVYNRCVGTRYCSNNCPYKVRRFNWFNNSDRKYNRPDLFKMQRNPDVTVRARGVMEKCTYCIQRIKAVTIPAKNERRAVRDGEIVPACAQTCPTQAIVFGDLNDTGSRVRRNQDDARAYAMLGELNVKPRTLYLAKVRNPSSGERSEAPGHHAGVPSAEPGGRA
ncbi:MAG: TAT-variant-translocated molybdopterin oxidoreductase [Candidatus Eiseniibacteriota bacterium]